MCRNHWPTLATMAATVAACVALVFMQQGEPETATCLGWSTIVCVVPR